MGVLHDRFAATARTHGGKPALQIGSVTTTYADLSVVADRITADLTDAAATTGCWIGLLWDRSPTAFAGLLAISRLGCAAVAVNAPEDARLKRLGVHAGLGPGGEVWRSGKPRGLRMDTAYVVATSGTTADRKEVPVPDTGLTALLDHVRETARFDSSDRVAVNYDPTFDPFYQVVGSAWQVGACLVVPERREHLAIPWFVEQRAITAWDGVPSHARLTGRDPAPDRRLRTLRTVTFGGEPLNAALMRNWRALAPAATLINAYGPSETTVTAFECVVEPSSPVPAAANGTVPIGQPLPGVEHAVVGDGASGELVIRGPQRFAGYLSDELNAGRFLSPGLESPVIGQSGPPAGDAWYRTGDLVTRHPEGLVHCGRIDEQVKLRGRRVDIAEVRHFVLERTGAMDAWVGVVADRLVAVAECGKEHRPTSLELEGLPRAVPILQVTQLPRLQNGKQDVVRLRALITSVWETVR